MTALLTCELCYAMSDDVRRSMARYAGSREPFQAIDRCRDAVACRSRVEASGEPWPLNDPAPAPTTSSKGQR